MRLSNPRHAGRVHCTIGDCVAGLRGASNARGHLQHPADGLDPVGITVAVDVVLQDFNRRSSSACVKNALAVFRMSLAWRSSLTSRSSSLMRWASELVVPGRWPLSTSAFVTQSFKVCGTQPIFGAIDSMAAHSDG